MRRFAISFRDGSSIYLRSQVLRWELRFWICDLKTQGLRWRFFGTPSSRVVAFLKELKDEQLRQEKAKMRKKTEHWNRKPPPPSEGGLLGHFVLQKWVKLKIWPFWPTDWGYGQDFIEERSGHVSCDRDSNPIHAMRTGREKSETKTLRNKGPFFPHFSLLVVRNWSWSA